MLDFKEKKLIKNIIYSKISIFILTLLLILLSKNVWGAYKDEKLTRKNMEISNHELQTLKEKRVKMLAKIEELKTDEGKEKEIRSKFRVSKKGEQMIMIIDNNKDKEKKPYTERKSLLKKIKDFFSF